MRIEVEHKDGDEYLVTVDGPGASTTHTVTVRPAYACQLGAADPVQLLQRSFEFLLEREPNTNILSRFDLSVIQRYFPEYERAIRTRL